MTERIISKGMHVPIFNIEYWRTFLKRIISVIKFLAERGLTFRDSKVVGSPHNGNYIDLVELIAKFDVFMTQHIMVLAMQMKKNETPNLLKTTYKKCIHLIAYWIKLFA